MFDIQRHAKGWFNELVTSGETDGLVVDQQTSRYRGGGGVYVIDVDCSRYMTALVETRNLLFP